MFDASLIFRPEVVWVFIPITAITLGIGTGLVKIILESAEKRLEMKLRLAKGNDTGTAQQIEALRAEIAALRDTNTQYDLSLQHNLDGLRARMEAMEKGRTPYPTVITEQEEQTQKVGGG